MHYEIKLLRKKYEQPNGKISLCTVKYPSFFMENDASDSMDPVSFFYRDFADRLCCSLEQGALFSLAEKYSSSVVSLESESTVSLCENEKISVYTDLRHYAERTLVGLLRISQSWYRYDLRKKEGVWLICKPPVLDFGKKKAARAANVFPFDGFYETVTHTVLYRCLFREGDGIGLRRSDQNRFFAEFPIEKRI